MNDLSNIANQVPWEALLVALGGGSVVALAAQILKKVFGLDSEKVIQFLVISLAFVASALQYLLSAHNIPPSVLGVHTAALLGVAQPFYLYAVKPSEKFLKQVRAYQASQDATNSDAQVAAVNPPADLELPEQPTNLSSF